MKSLLQAYIRLACEPVSVGGGAAESKRVCGYPVEESAVSRPASEGSCGRSALAATPAGHAVHFSASDICNGLLYYVCNN